MFKFLILYLRCDEIIGCRRRRCSRHSCRSHCRCHCRHRLPPPPLPPLPPPLSIFHASKG